MRYNNEIEERTIHQYENRVGSYEKFASIISYCCMCYFCVIVGLFIYCVIIYLNRG